MLDIMAYVHERVNLTTYVFTSLAQEGFLKFIDTKNSEIK